ncbi:TPA: hypothetical protein EYP26_02995 [Candidatus Bathyarchaeota archaeon]|nr:hypothetical protein [Candidatus Bathyarchaeota archaeon]
MLKEKIRFLKECLRISNAEEIYRRYFVMNMFDGALTALGIVVGAYFSGASSPKVILGAVLGAGLAMGLSGFSGAYMAERAERLRKLDELRRAMLKDLNNSIHEKAARLTSIWAALIDGASPLLAALLSIFPFLLSLTGLISVQTAARASVAAIMVLLFLIGMFLGKISRENLIFSGAKMIFVGAVTAILVMIGSSYLS